MNTEINKMCQQKITTVRLGRVLIKIANLINVRFGPLCGLTSDITRGPKRATSRHSTADPTRAADVLAVMQPPDIAGPDGF